MISAVLLFCIFMTANTIDICKENEGNPRIKVGLRINDYTVLISSNKKVYRIENFKFDGKHFNYENIKDLSKEWIIDGKEEMYAFPIPYKKNESFPKEVRIVHIRKEQSEQIDQLFSYQSLHNKDLTQVLNEDRFSLLIYKFKPEPTNSSLYDPLTLSTLFAKFPADHIENNIKTIMTFPLNIADIPVRLFVYYLEKPTKKLLKIRTGDKFKRHIMIGKRIFYGNQNSSQDDPAKDSEIDWQHDPNSGKCIDEDIVVNAAFPITDYTSVGNHYEFDIIEFSGDLYFVKRVKLDQQRVAQDLQLLKAGTIGSIFNCSTSVTFPVLSKPTVSSETNVPPVQTAVAITQSQTTKYMIYLANFALLIVIVSIVLMVYGIFFPNDPIR